MKRDSLLIFPERDFSVLDILWLRKTHLPNLTVFCHADDHEKVLSLGGTVVHYKGGHLAPCRDDLADLTRQLPSFAETDVSLYCPANDIPHPFALSTLRLLGIREAHSLTKDGKHSLRLRPVPDQNAINTLLLKACGGIGNLVLTTSLLSASLSQGWKTYFSPTSDLDATSLAELFDGNLPKGLRLIRPNELKSIEPDVILNIEDHASLEEDDFFHAPYRIGTTGHEPGFAAQFFKNITGVTVDISRTFVGGTPDRINQDLKNRIVVCPGSKNGWDSKRWPHMDALLRRLDNPIVLCRKADLDAYETLDFLTPITAPNAEYLTNSSLQEAASILASASIVIANDCGPAHIAAATGTPTLFLFGPSSQEKNRHPRPNVINLSLNLDCQPCQGRTDGPGRLAPHDYNCETNFQCLAGLSEDMVLDAVHRHMRHMESK
ncbi:MAG: glycosyltransferase family 9 protein [Pseudodesulfovibrio sp.]|nr:glycosyltransferase family 9 protein [Pseudodesulfovibrio sp.]